MSSPEVLKEFWYDLTDEKRNAILNDCHDEYDNFLLGKPFNIGVVNQYFKVDNQKFIRQAQKGNLELVKIYIQLGADIHTEDDYALQLASRHGHLKVVKYLIKQGANIHANNDYALRLAAQYGNLSVVKYLVKHGANVHARSNLALMWAIENNCTKVVEYLKSIT